MIFSNGKYKSMLHKALVNAEKRDLEANVDGFSYPRMHAQLKQNDELRVLPGCPDLTTKP